MNKLKSILRILISLILLKYVQSNCPNVEEWHEFKSKYRISFYNSALEFAS
jgi:hypothetical protein